MSKSAPGNSHITCLASPSRQFYWPLCSRLFFNIPRTKLQQGCYSQNRNWSNLWSRKILLLEQINPNLEQITGRNTSILEHKISNLEQFNKKIYFFSAKQRMQGIQHQHNRALVSVDTKCAWQKWPTNSAGNCKAWWICTNLESMLIQVLSVFTGPSKETKNSSAPANILFVLRNAIRWPK